MFLLRWIRNNEHVNPEYVPQHVLNTSYWLFKPFNNSVKCVLLSLSCYRWENWDIERFIGMPGSQRKWQSRDSGSVRLAPESMLWHGKWGKWQIRAVFESVPPSNCELLSPDSVDMSPLSPLMVMSLCVPAPPRLARERLMAAFPPNPHLLERPIPEGWQTATADAVIPKWALSSDK